MQSAIDLWLSRFIQTYNSLYTCIVEREREDIESKTCGAHIKSGARASRARKQPGARCNGCNLNIMQMTAKLSSQIPVNDKVLAREEIKIENMPCRSRDPTP